MISRWCVNLQFLFLSWTQENGTLWVTYSPLWSVNLCLVVSSRITELTALRDKLKEQNTKKEKTISTLKTDIQKLVHMSTNPSFCCCCSTQISLPTNMFSQRGTQSLINICYMCSYACLLILWSLSPYPFLRDCLSLNTRKPVRLEI